jgi:hypothetical protein
VRRERKLKDVLARGDTTLRFYIEECRCEIIETTQRLFDSGAIYFDKGFRREDYEIVIEEAAEIDDQPESITSNEEIPVLKGKPVPSDSGSLSAADFTALYYQYMEAIRYFHERAHQEGILALDEELENIENEFFHLGMRLLVDGKDGNVIHSVLSNYIVHEPDYYKRILRQIIMEGVLGIQDCGSLERLMIRLNSMVNIKDNKISARITEYLCGDIHALSTCFDNIPCRPAPL